LRRPEIRKALRDVADIDARLSWDGRRLAAESHDALSPGGDAEKLARILVELAHELRRIEAPAAPDGSTDQPREQADDWNPPE
ncbi:MAG: hypothetical protein ABEN55_04735, partial [Bradymonadaceae bacterium]